MAALRAGGCCFVRSSLRCLAPGLWQWVWRFSVKVGGSSHALIRTQWYPSHAAEKVATFENSTTKMQSGHFFKIQSSAHKKPAVIRPLTISAVIFPSRHGGTPGRGLLLRSFLSTLPCPRPVAVGCGGVLVKAGGDSQSWVWRCVRTGVRPRPYAFSIPGRRSGKKRRRELSGQLRELIQNAF